MAHPPVSPPYRFGPFVLDPTERRLTRDGQPVPLSRRLMTVLVVLVERAGRLVTKEDLLAAAWPDAVVEENALSVAVSRLRRTLGSSGGSAHYIETVPGYGYRFKAPVEAHPPPSPGTPPPPSRKVGGGWIRRALAVVGVAILLGGGALLRTTASPPPDLAPVVLSAQEGAPADPSPEAADRRRAAAEATARGRALLDARRSGPEALRAFYLARALDSTYAPAYLGIAEAYAMGHRTHVEATAVLEKALQLDPGFGEAYAVLGFVHAFQRWDWAAAAAAFTEARALAPEHVRTHQWHAALLLVQRRLAEAELALEQALALAPASANLHSDLCEVRMARRAFGAARAACEQALALDPDFPFARHHLFWLDLHEGQHEEALRRFAANGWGQGGEPSPDTPPDRFLRALAERYERTAETVPYEAYFLARLQAFRGEREAALRALGWAVGMREFHVPFANADPAFEGIRDDPRFRELMRKVGLQP